MNYKLILLALTGLTALGSKVIKKIIAQRNEKPKKEDRNKRKSRINEQSKNEKSKNEQIKNEKSRKEIHAISTVNTTFYCSYKMVIAVFKSVKNDLSNYYETEYRVDVVGGIHKLKIEYMNHRCFIKAYELKSRIELTYETENLAELPKLRNSIEKILKDTIDSFSHIKEYRETYDNKPIYNSKIALCTMCKEERPIPGDTICYNCSK